MAIGRTFEESFQKAIRQVDPKFDGLQGDKFDDLDDVLQINNVFTNVSKGEVAKSNEMQNAFGTTSVDKIVSEVCITSSSLAFDSFSYSVSPSVHGVGS